MDPLKKIDENVERVLEKSHISWCKIRVVDVKYGKERCHELEELVLPKFSAFLQLLQYYMVIQTI